MLNRGAVVEQGTHEGLLAARGAYFRLVNAQKLSVAAEDVDDRASSSGSSSGDGADDAAPDAALPPVDRVETTASAWSVRSALKYEDVSRQRGLFHCLAIIFHEHRRLWPWFAAGVAGCVMGGAICESAPARPPIRPD